MSVFKHSDIVGIAVTLFGILNQYTLTEQSTPFAVNIL